IKETNPEKPLHALMTVEDYADVIVWGLKGLLTREMPGCVRWNFIDEYWNTKEKQDEWRELIKSHFWSFTGMEDFKVPNPFCIEMATDLLNELKEMKPGIAGMSDDEIRNRIMKMAESVQKTWDEEERGGVRAGVKAGGGELPPDVREKEYVGPVGTGTRSKAIELMYEVAISCGLAVVKDDLYLLKGNKKYKPEEITDRVSKARVYLKTWLRPGKWGAAANPIKAPTTQDLTRSDFSSPKFDAECVDRAFYKSCNMMALQTMAWSVFREE
ncbi:MAG: hypothetical protein JSW64_03640, partial [Candidatus Zixiibacteriota bacterium]